MSSKTAQTGWRPSYPQHNSIPHYILTDFADSQGRAPSVSVAWNEDQEIYLLGDNYTSLDIGPSYDRAKAFLPTVLDEFTNAYQQRLIDKSDWLKDCLEKSYQSYRDPLSQDRTLIHLDQQNRIDILKSFQSFFNSWQKNYPIPPLPLSSNTHDNPEHRPYGRAASHHHASDIPLHGHSTSQRQKRDHHPLHSHSDPLAAFSASPSSKYKVHTPQYNPRSGDEPVREGTEPGHHASRSRTSSSFNHSRAVYTYPSLKPKYGLRRRKDDHNGGALPSHLTRSESRTDAPVDCMDKYVEYIPASTPSDPRRRPSKSRHHDAEIVEVREGLSSSTSAAGKHSRPPVIVYRYI